MKKQSVLPRWRGFNLLGMFVMSSPGFFEEEDFQIVSDLGFDFVRLPLNYTFWINNNDPFDINEEKIGNVDQAVRWGEKYGIHVNVAFHRGPGFSVAKDRVEPFDLWRDAEALDAFKLHWATMAKRYKGIDNKKVSFDLLNEPAGVSPEGHAHVMRETVKAIHEADPTRLIILDGLNYGNVPLPDLGDLAKDNVAQSCRAYIPGGLTHYKANWVRNKDNSEPKWPGGIANDGVWDRERLEKHYGAWAALADNFGFGVHCGEGGCFSFTPHDVALSWMEDVLDILTGYNIGYALWNLKGAFGILDSGRTDVAYEDYKGHKLDRKMLDLLKKY
ncbi:MAG: cellulase family glycosylhydrolase [Clostridiales bacterium]|jgi:endoglucanase|nr:cellulase family glycosylhydrolase [Clostridiales bacterium]